MANYKVYEIKFKDGMVYYGYTAKPFKMRMAEHIDASQKGKSILYKKMRNVEYDCDARVIQQFPTMEEALDWEKKLIKNTPHQFKLNTSWGGENGENNYRKWKQQDIIKKHYKRKRTKYKF